MDNRIDLIDSLESNIKALIEEIWGDVATISKVREWYMQFQENDELHKDEQIQFLFLLSKYIFFGKKEVFFMLRTMYKDLFKYRLIRGIRRNNNDTLDESFLETEYEKILNKTRFLGIGNPSESGTFLLYKYRQINSLSKDLFINSHEIFNFISDLDATTGQTRQIAKIRNNDIENYIFIDDLTCSGSQAIGYSSSIVALIKKLNPNAKVHYLVLVATKKAIDAIKSSSEFDIVDSVFKLDETFKCFSDESRYYESCNQNHYDRTFTKDTCVNYDLMIQEPTYTLGFNQSQLLLSFEHNTPDNVPPIFWSVGNSKKSWFPIFQRFHKIY